MGGTGRKESHDDTVAALLILRVPISLSPAARFDSRRREQLVGGARQVVVAFQRGLAQGDGRRVQQAIGQRVREEIEHGVRILARGELLPRLRQHVRAGAVAMRAQALERSVRVLAACHSM